MLSHDALNLVRKTDSISKNTNKKYQKKISTFFDQDFHLEKMLSTFKCIQEFLLGYQ